MSGLTMRTGGPTSIQVARDPKTAQMPRIFSHVGIFVTRRLAGFHHECYKSTFQPRIHPAPIRHRFDIFSAPHKVFRAFVSFVGYIWIPFHNFHNFHMISHGRRRVGTISLLPDVTSSHLEGVPIVCTGCTHATAVYFLDTGT